MTYQNKKNIEVARMIIAILIIFYLLLPFAMPRSDPYYSADVFIVYGLLSHPHEVE